MKKAKPKRGKKSLPIILPKFKSEDDERAYWDKFDISKYDVKQWDFRKVSFPNLKPTSRPISLRIPEPIICRVKEEANRMNVPYQSLMKQYIAEGVER